MIMSIPADPSLPHLSAIFRGIRAGRHWCYGDPEYPDLIGERFDEYRDFFARIDLALHRDTRGFVYATTDDDDYKGSNLITRLVVFTAVWVDAIADEGSDIARTLLAPRQPVANLPHLQAESHRRILAQIDVKEPEHLVDILKSLERLGFLEWDTAEHFTLRASFHRLLDVCRDARVPDAPTPASSDPAYPTEHDLPDDGPMEEPHE